MCYRWCATACPKQLFNMLTQSMPQQWHRGHNACSKSLLPIWSMQLRVTAMHIYSSKHLKGSFEGTCPHVYYIYYIYYILPPRARRAHRNSPTYTHPPSVGMIYPIPTYIFNWYIFQKCTFSQPCVGTLKLSILHSSPKCWHDISNTNIYIQLINIAQNIYSTNIYLQPSNLHSFPKG